MGVLLSSLPVVSSAARGEEPFPGCTMGSLLERLLHELLQGEFISGTAALHKLLQHGSLSHALTWKDPAPAWAPLSVGLQAPAWSLLQHRFLMESQPLLRHPLLQHGLLQVLQVHLCSPCPPWAAGAQLPDQGLPQGISVQSAPAPGAAPGPPPALPCPALGVCRVVPVSHVLTLVTATTT